MYPLYVGTRDYWAPEIWAADEEQAAEGGGGGFDAQAIVRPAIEYYACGILLAELLTGEQFQFDEDSCPRPTLPKDRIERRINLLGKRLPIPICVLHLCVLAPFPAQRWGRNCTVRPSEVQWCAMWPQASVPEWVHMREMRRSRR